MNAMLLETKDLCKYYGSGENLVKAIDHTTMTIQRGEFTAIVGRSGSGKSTLLHMLGALDRPDKGSVWIEGKNVFDLKDEELAVFRRRKIGFIFQNYNLIPSLNVWENIVLPMGLDKKKVDRKFVRDLTERIGIADKLKSLPNTLSGGQQQGKNYGKQCHRCCHYIHPGFQKTDLMIFDHFHNNRGYGVISTIC